MSEHPGWILQDGYAIGCEWGPNAVGILAPSFDVVVIVDVFSFSTSVDIATARGATIFPYRFRDDSARGFADEVDASLAGENPRGHALEPHSLVDIEPGTRLVLPSPNGSTLSLGTGRATTFAGCLRNRTAVARHAAEAGGRILVVPAGEGWPSDESLQPALEDLCGAGAIIDALPDGLSRSPEARVAAAAFRDARPHLRERLAECASGREKRSKGLEADVDLAAALDVSDCVPVLADGAYSSTRASIRSR